MPIHLERRKWGIDNPLDREKELLDFIQRHRGLRSGSDLTLVERWDLSAFNCAFRAPLRQFWKQLFEELKIIIDALHDSNFTGSLSTFGEEIVRVSLTDARLEGVFTRADLVLDGERIRCSVLNGGIYYLNFVVTSGEGIAVQDIQKDADPMDARKAAEHMIDRMLHIIEWNGS